MYYKIYLGGYIMKKNYYKLNLNKNIAIIDGAVYEIMRQNFLDDIIDSLLKEEDEVLEEMVVEFNIRYDDFKKFLLDIDKVSDLQLDKIEFLNRTPEFFSDKFINKLIDESKQEIKETLLQVIKMAEELEDVDDANAIIEHASRLFAIDNYNDLITALKGTSLPRKPSRKTSDKEYRDSIKDLYNSIAGSKDYKFGFDYDIAKNVQKFAIFADKCKDIVLELYARLLKYKTDFSVFTFNDIAKFCLYLLDDDLVVDELKSEFKYVLVDEYQDTSDIQEAVIKKLENNNIFMVGDVKQSIYRFRNANCQIFQDKYLKYKGEDSGHVVDMNANYRSREQVLDDVNKMFSTFMVGNKSAIDYRMGHIAQVGAKYYDPFIVPKQDYGIIKYTYDYDKDVIKDVAEYEARIVIEDIVRKLKLKYQIYDKEKRELRPCRLNDFAIIVDRSTSFDSFKKIASDYGLPVFIIANEKINESKVIFAIKNVLKMILSIYKKDSNMLKYSYVAVARSFLFRLRDQEIYDTIKNDKIKESEIYLKCNDLVNDIFALSLNELLIKVCDVFDVYEKIYTIGDYSNHFKHLEILLNQMKTLDSLLFSFEDMVQFFEDIGEKEIDIESSPVKESENAISIMTIHKSKGLEFKICYFPMLNKEFNKEELKKSFFCSPEYGYIFPLYDENGLNSLQKHLYRRKYLLEDYQEKLRLFYVALTRCEELGILIDCRKEEKKKINMENVNSFHELLSFYHFDSGKEYVVNGFNPSLVSEDYNGEDEEFELLEKPIISYQEIKKNRASKQKGEDASQEALDFGTHMHFILENVDYETKDTSFISNKRERKYIDKVLAMDIFKDVKNDNIRHEFSYYDEVNKVNGIIDALIIKDKEIDIIDFKLKHLDDEEYVVQLNTYYDYISQISDKNIKMYLISIIDGDIKEINRERNSK